jgi:hypothetical protein
MLHRQVNVPQRRYSAEAVRRDGENRKHFVPRHMRPDILRTIGKRGPESSAMREHNIVGDLGHMPQDMVDYRIQSDSRGVTIRCRSIRGGDRFWGSDRTG